MTQPPIAHIDFESFSELDIRKVGTSRMAEHPSTEILCMAWAIGDEEPKCWIPRDAFETLAGLKMLNGQWHHHEPAELFHHFLGDGLVYAWNVEMEIPHWRKIMVKRHGWPAIPDTRWRDTAAVSLTYGLPPKLEHAGHALGLDAQVLKDTRGKTLLNKLAKPRRKKGVPRWTVADAPQDYADLYRYCIQDVVAERAIHHALPTQDLTRKELAIWRLTTRMNLRGVTIDIRDAVRMLEVLEDHRRRLRLELAELTFGMVETENQIEKLVTWAASQGVGLPNLQAETVENLLKSERALPDRVRRVLEIRLSLAKASTKKYDAMENRVCDDGSVKNNVLHHGASTGRDAGRGVQFLNLPRANVANIKGMTDSEADHALDLAHQLLWLDNPVESIGILRGDVHDYAKRSLRSYLVAREGHDLIAADLASIENRITVWLADCKYGINLFEKGLDEYKLFASTRLFPGIDYDEIDSDQRQIAKPAVLGCCFGLAWKGLQRQAEGYGVILTEDKARAAVKGYRTLYHEVVSTWYDLENAAKYAIETGEPSRLRRIRFRMFEDFLMMRLPSGREIAYYQPKVEDCMTPWGKMRPTITHSGFLGNTKVWGRVRLIPGRLFENAVQATARCVMMAGAIRVAKAAAGYEMIIRVYDELVAEVLEGQGDLGEFVELMVKPEPWLTGIPIGADGWRGKRYRKQ